MNIEEKINILFYLFGICMILWILRISISIKTQLSPKVLVKCKTRLADWESKGNYKEMLANLDRYLEMYPGEIDFLWSKGVALYKLKQFEDARRVFLDLSRNEPEYKNSADRYMASIDEKEHA
jgi:tetratricopeptide (TPR) repeat protein